MGGIRQLQRKWYILGWLVSLCLGVFLIYLINLDNQTIFLDNQPEDLNLSKEKQSIISIQVDSLLVQCNGYINRGEFLKALDVAERGLKIAKASKKHKSVGDYYDKIATVHYYQGGFSKALSYFEKGIKAYQQAGFENGVATLVNNQGAIHYYLGNFPQALEQYKKAAALNAKLNNQMQSATTIQNIGGIYLELDQLDQAMKNFQSAEKTYQSLSDTLSLSQISNSIGDVYQKMGANDLALDKFKEALRLAQLIYHQQSILEVLYNLGDVYQQLLVYDSAMIYYNQANDLSSRMNNVMYQSLSRIGLGFTFLDMNRLSSAIDYCKNGLRISTDIKAVSVQQKACDCLYQAYKLSKESKAALVYLEKSLVLKDSLNARLTADKILNMEFERKTLLDSIAHREKEQRVAQEHQRVLRNREKQRNIIVVMLVFIAVVAIAIWSRLNYVRKSKKRLQFEKDRSEHLLLNILPSEIADELKNNGYVKARNFTIASILFTDFKSFTATAAKLSSQELVQELNICFKAFDHIIGRYNVEKIKTIGDAYMAAGGVPVPDANAVENTILAALEMQEFIKQRKVENDLLNKPSFEMRVGVHSGPIVAGIVGVKKFQYDIWGDTVNTASRMESNCDVGHVNISMDTYLLIKDSKRFVFESRGKIHAKGKGEIDMFFVSKSRHELFEKGMLVSS